MSEYNLSKKTVRLLSIKDGLSLKDVSNATQQEIDRINSSENKNRYLKKLYQPQFSKVNEKTFIIPSVGSSAITGYLFTKKNISEPHALIIFYHDGGWILGNMDKCRAICSNICVDTGAAVLAVDYRLAPNYKFPIPVEDCYNALIWASQGARYWKIDPQKVFLMGDGAGGNLVAAVSRLSRDRKGPSIAGQILIEPITDCRLRTESFIKYKDNPSISPKDIVFCIQNYQREPKDILDPSFSPLLAIDFSRLPQTLIISPEYDPMRDDAVYYEKSLRSAEVPARLLTVKQQVHGYFSYPKAEGWNETVKAVNSFLLSKPLDTIFLS